MQHVVRRFAALMLLGALVLAFPAAAAAQLGGTGNCTATATSSGGSSIDIKASDLWHIDSTDTAGGSGTSAVPMKTATVYAYVIGGLSIPIAGGSGSGDTSGSVTGVSVATYAALGARFWVGGSASGDGGAACSGRFEIILDDVNPLLTALGGGGVVLFLICLIAVALLARSGGGCFMVALSVLVGLLGGAALGVAAGQFGLLDATEPVGLALPVAGAAIGGATCGRFRPRPPASPTPAPPPPPPPGDETQSFVNDVAAPGVNEAGSSTAE
jgi:hypothetical protein